MIILAIDLGKFTSTACVWDTVKGEHRFEKVANPGGLPACGRWSL